MAELHRAKIAHPQRRSEGSSSVAGRRFSLHALRELKV
jgi:hypothetical protein